MELTIGQTSNIGLGGLGAAIQPYFSQTPYKAILLYFYSIIIQVNKLNENLSTP